jgi:hypothetical protein
MLAVKLGTAVSWQWYVLIGSISTFAIGYAASLVMPETRRGSSALRP